MNTEKIIPMFVFGTLMSDTTLAILDVAPVERTNAILKGFKKQGLNIIEDEESEVHGHYFLINAKELETLDVYESIDSLRGYYRFLVNVQVGNEFRRAYVYKIKGTT